MRLLGRIQMLCKKPEVSRKALPRKKLRHARCILGQYPREPLQQSAVATPTSLATGNWPSGCARWREIVSLHNRLDIWLRHLFLSPSGSFLPHHVLHEPATLHNARPSQLLPLTGLSASACLRHVCQQQIEHRDEAPAVKRCLWR